MTIEFDLFNNNKKVEGSPVPVPVDGASLAALAFQAAPARQFAAEGNRAMYNPPSYAEQNKASGTVNAAQVPPEQTKESQDRAKELAKGK